MAYADQQQMSSSKIVSIALVVLIHALFGYALVTGLAYSAVKKVASELDMIDIQEEEPPEEIEEPPPPPPDQPIEPPPVVTPPPIVQPPSAPRPVIQQQRVSPPVVAPVVAAPPPAPPPPPPPPQRANPEPRGNPGNWANANDYPSRALREEREGTTSFRVTVGSNGRVSDCQITGSSGHSDLDAATCKNIQRRARFRPALDNAGNPVAASWSSRVRWQIPK